MQRNLELARLGDLDRLAGLAALGAHGLHLLHDVHALGHGAEDDVLAVEPVGLDGAQEELRAVRVGAGVGHGEDTGAGVLHARKTIEASHTQNGNTATTKPQQ